MSRLDGEEQDERIRKRDWAIQKTRKMRMVSLGLELGEQTHFLQN